MHNTAFRDKGLKYTYLAFKVEAANLGTALEGARVLGFRGLNITIPHKVKVVTLMDELDPLCRRIGAVNTVVNNRGSLKGYNTDAAGFMKALEGRDIRPSGKKVVILGAGGAAMAVAFSLVDAGNRVAILNRQAHLGQAVQLAEKLSATARQPVEALTLNEQNLASCLGEADILVNATSVGMHPRVKESLVPARLLRPEMTVFDLIYNPLRTRLLADAEMIGATTINGLEMLIWQAALAFELWTGLSAPVGAMRSETLNALQGTTRPEPETRIPRNKAGSKNSIALIGFMGSGKTTVAGLISARTGRQLVELDRLIEINAGASIPAIFDKHGEQGFRELEIQTVKEIAGGQNQVISCGGGTVLNKINIDRLKQSAVVVYLAASQSTILQRLQGQEVEKPVLIHKDDPEEIRALINFREPFYRAYADIIIDTSRLSPEETAERVIQEIQKYAG